MAHYKDRETCFRSKSVILTGRDELAFNRVLREFSPDVMFFNRADGISGPVPSIPDCSENLVMIALPAPGQERQWKLNIETETQMVVP